MIRRLTFRAQSGRTALIWTAIKGHTDCVRLLLDAGADTSAMEMVR
jgi:ankyrin repeat protein